jgi:glucokinase
MSIDNKFMKEAVIGVDIGGTKIAAHVCNQQYETLYEKTIRTPDEEGAQLILDAVIKICRDLMQQAQDTKIIAVGIGAAGQIHPETGVVLDANENLKGWKGTPVKATITKALDMPVYVDNDVRTMALAEATIGAGVSYDHLLCLTVGTGIGGAIILNKQLWYGAHFSAGEFGYILHQPAHSIESVASGGAQALTYARKTRKLLSLPQIAQQASEGDSIAREVITNGAKALGETLAPIMLFLSPQAVIIGGGVPEIGDLWWHSFRKTILSFDYGNVRQTPVLQAQLGSRAGVIGAAILAWQKANSDEA